MTPAKRAFLIHSRIQLFRGAPNAAVEVHMRNLDAVHTVELPGRPQDHPTLELALDAIEDSPASINDRLLAVLFGAWPPGAMRHIGTKYSGLPGPEVTELAWSEWLECGR